jgi:hypothetical protein
MAFSAVEGGLHVPSSAFPKPRVKQKTANISEEGIPIVQEAKAHLDD